MRGMVAIMALAIPLAACQFVPGTEANKFAEVQQLLRNQMRDPESVQFRDMQACPRTAEAIAGNFNAKNEFGGYLGFEAFYFIPGSGLILSNSPFYENADKVCFGSR